MGQTNTLAQGINLDYLYQQGPDNYVDEIGENGGRLYFRDQSGIGRAISYNPGNYRTILSTVIFGALQGIQKENLMRSYVRYLLFGIGIEEERDTALKIILNPIIYKEKVFLRIPEGITSIRIFNIFGQLVKEWQFNGNNSRIISWNLFDDSDKKLPAGNYFLLTSGSYTITQSFILLP